MSAHLISDETATTTTLDPATDAGWLALSAAVTEEAPLIADRDDLVVTVAPGAGRGCPACFFPPHAAIEIDGVYLPAGVDPGTAAPQRSGDRGRYAALWGLLVHECAHARHSRWDPPPGAPPAVVSAALLLEESRIEGAHIRRRPDDRHWLRASATGLVLDEIGPGSGMTRPEAAHTAGLLLARVDAGILTPPETAPVAATIETILGAATLAQLREIWQAAHRTDDDDVDTMLELARRWCDTVGIPTAPTPAATPPGSSGTPHTPVTPTGEPTRPGETPTGEGTGEPGETGEMRAPSDMDRAISATLARVATAVACEPLPADPAELATAAADEEARAAAAADRSARRVFSPTRGHTSSGSTAISGTRPPDPAERVAARQLGRALDTAAVRDRAVIKTGSVLPPGRLRMRGALAADAQRAAGATPTAERFVRATRKITPAPPLRLGIACDVSGSMRAVAAPVASAAWILAQAAHHTRTDACTATVIFGKYVRPITRPGETPPQVAEFDAVDGTEDVPTALDALDGALGLCRPGAARLLVVISDGQFTARRRAAGQTRIDRLRHSGCAVLWLAPPSPYIEPLDGATVHTLTDPTTTARAIGKAATTALRTAR
ncbi:vWA domain-containing protein [Pseudonocardia adelaidensis]|uniref:VWA domain containing CoxE-like protein n=1 Tax=Pseudonocardia adelaidensis TaxID=648754 RepID=A0ABP9NJV3_9PSEU